MVSEYLQDEYVERLRQSGTVVYDPDLYVRREELFAQLRSAEAIFIRNRTQIDTELLAAAPDLAVVGRLGVGLDNIDLEVCAQAGVEVIPAIGLNAVSVAEYVMGAILTLHRPVFGMTPSMTAGEWPRQGHAFGQELMGKTLGLIGFGAVARHVARRAAAFGMAVLAYDPYLPLTDPAWIAAQRSELDELLRSADVISVHTPRTDETIGLIGVEALQKMKPTALLINTSRGGIVDEVALVEALRNRRIGGAALDVFAVEPLRADHAAAFRGIDRLILTPHVAGNTDESVDRIARTIVDVVIERLDASASPESM